MFILSLCVPDTIQGTKKIDKQNKAFAFMFIS